MQWLVRVPTLPTLKADFMSHEFRGKLMSAAKLLVGLEFGHRVFT